MNRIPPAVVRVLLLAAMTLLLTGCKEANRPPSAPVLVGPLEGEVGVKLSYSVSSDDRDDDMVAFRIAWGDGKTSDWSRPVFSDDTVSLKYSWTAPGTYSLSAQAKDQRGHESHWSAELTLDVRLSEQNLPPLTPKLSGPDSGSVGQTLSYTVVTIDPDTDLVVYRIAWADGDTSDWSQIVLSGDSATMSHSWTAAGTYMVTAQAKDHRGHESEWSAGMTLRVRSSEYPDTVIATVPVGALPFGPCVTPDGQYLYVPTFTGNTVLVVRTSDNTEVTRIALAGRPSAATPSPDGQCVYVSCSNGSAVARIRVADNTVVSTIPTPTDPWLMTFSPDGSLLYVGLFRSSSYRVAAVRMSDDSIVATPDVGCDPWGLAVTPDGAYLYVALWCDDFVSVLRTADNTVVDTIPVGHQLNGLAMTTDGQFVYVAAESSDAVYVIRTSDNTVVATIPVQDQPTGIALLPSDRYLYVASYASDYVSVIRTSDNTVVKQIHVGGHPDRFAVLTDGSAVYVSVQDEGCVKVIGCR
jgi:YVTN family beta-propeller protein